MEKNQVISGKCIDYTYDGLGVVKYDTFTIFVKDMILNEEAEIILTKVQKNFAYGKIVKLLSASKERVESPCGISRPCGGCQLMHMSKSEQARMKHDHVQQVIRQIGKIDQEVLPVIRAEKPYGYRNKVMLPVGKDKNGHTVIGFYRQNSHDIIPVENCLLQSARANELVSCLRKWIEELKLADEIRHIMIRDMQRTEQMMLVLVTYHKNVSLDELVLKVRNEFKEIRSIIQNINGEETNVVLGKEEKLLYGSENIQDILCNRTFNISTHSFYQVNTYQTEVLYNKAIELSKITKEDTVLDLYCGVGTIGLIASQYCKKVIGVEIVEDAVLDGRENIQLNQADNIELICQDAKIAAKELLEQGNHFDCIFVDPPRKGCSEEALKTLVSFNSKRIVYISCNPSTLARDLAYLKDFYDIQTIQPVDMFPNTYHTETICLLVRK